MPLSTTQKEHSAPPTSQATKSNLMLTLLIDNFTLTTWLLIGACLQGNIYMLISRRLSITLLIPHLILLWRTTQTLLMYYGFIHNSYMDDVIPGTYTVQMPKADGTYELSEEEVIVFLVGARFNHPLGMLAPGGKELVKYFEGMQKDLEDNREKYGMLGGSAWVGGKERASNNDNLSIYYFKDTEGVQKFTQENAHREGWDWYTKFEKEHKHLGIRHELYRVPKKNWENVFLNCHPTLFGATSYLVKPDGEDEKWVGPAIVDGNGSKFKTIRERMGIRTGKDD